jgi:hypothetical protein
VTTAEILTAIAAFCSVALATLVFIRDRRKAKAEARAIDAQARASDSSVDLTDVEIEDRIAARRLGELNRLYARVKELEVAFADFKKAASLKDRAFANVLRDAAEQWPKEVPGPLFAPEDLAVLEDTMPHVWRFRLRPK